MPAQVVVLNGGSSSGKSTIARHLQDLLPDPWLSLSIDTLVDALPERLRTGGEGIGFTNDGDVQPGEAFRALENAWLTGIAAMARAGAHVIVDDVFLSGAESQNRWRQALAGQDVLWVGVHCDPEVAEAREQERGDRITGMASKQATMVHDGVTYDVEVDTTLTTAEECAGTIATAAWQREARN